MHYLVLSWKSELWMGLQNLAVQNKCSVCNIYSRLTNVLHLYKRYKLLKKNVHVFEIFSSFYFICSACRTHLKNYNNGVQWQVFHHLILTKFNKFTLPQYIHEYTFINGQVRSCISRCNCYQWQCGGITTNQTMSSLVHTLPVRHIYNSMAFRVACLWINVQKCYCISYFKFAK